MDGFSKSKLGSDATPAIAKSRSRRGTVLFVDQDPAALEDASKAFEDAGYVVTSATTAADARRLATGGGIDLLVIDPSMPDDDGLKLVHELSLSDSLCIIIVSQRGRTLHKVVGLEMGADDYLAKPVDCDEIVARANALLRRVRKLYSGQKSELSTTSQKFSFDDWTYDGGRRDLKNSSGQLVDLTSMETDLLEIFLRNPGASLSRQTIVASLGRQGEAASLRHIDVLVSKLRRKIEADDVIRIKTIRGAGYMFVARLTA